MLMPATFYSNTSRQAFDLDKRIAGVKENWKIQEQHSIHVY